MTKEKRMIILFIAIELLIGILAGSAFIFADFYKSPTIELTLSVPLFYLALIAIFLLSTIVPGFLNLWLLKLHKKFFRFSLFSVAGGIISLIFYMFSFSFFSYVLNVKIVPMFLILIGFIGGFNFSLLKNSDDTLMNK